MKHCLTVLLLMAIAPLAWSVSNTLTTNASSCPVTSNTAALVVGFPPDQGGVTLNVSGTWTGTISFKSSGDGGATWNTMKATPSDFSTNVSSTTGNGMWQRNISGITGICMLSSAAMTGTAIVTVTRAVPAFASVNSSGGIGGDTITSPNSTLTIGGDSSNTTLDLLGSAGKIMAGATPSLTATPALGTDNSIAGTIQLANGSSNAHTTWASGATTSNTIKGFATVPTTGHIVTCTTASTTCTLTDGGVAATNPMTTAGDMIIGGASGTPTRLPIGTNSFVLGVTAGVPTWVANTSGSSSGTNTLNISNGSSGFTNVPTVTGTSGGLLTIGQPSTTGVPLTVSTTSEDPFLGTVNEVNVSSDETTSATTSNFHRMLALNLTHRGFGNGTEASQYSLFYANPHTGSDAHDFTGAFRFFAIPGASGGSGVVAVSIGASLYSTVGYGNTNGLTSSNGLANTVGELNNIHIDPDDAGSPTANGTTIVIGNERRILVPGAPGLQTDVSWTGQVAGISFGAGYGQNVVGAASSWGGTCCVSAPGSVIGVTSGGWLLQGASAADAAPLALGVHSTILSSAKFDQASTAQSIIQHTVTGDTNVDSAEVDGIQFDHQFNHSGTNALGDIYGTHMYLHEDGTTGASTVTNFFQFSGKAKIAAGMTATNAGIFNCETATITGTVTNTFHCLNNNNANETIFSLGNVGIGSGKNNPATALDVNGTVTATTFAGNLTGNLTGGAAGSIPYQSGASTTALLATGTAKQILVAGSTPAYVDFPDVKVIPAAECNNATAGPGWDIPASGVTATCRAGTNNLGAYLAVTPSAATGIMQFGFEIPGDWDTTQQPYIGIQYTSASNTSGTVIHTISTACTKNDGSITDDPAFVAESAMGTQTMAAANRSWGQSAQLVNVTSGNNCIPGGWIRFKVAVTGTASSAIGEFRAMVTTPRLITVQAN